MLGYLHRGYVLRPSVRSAGRDSEIKTYFGVWTYFFFHRCFSFALIVPLLMNPSLRHRTFEQFGRTTLIGWESAQRTLKVDQMNLSIRRNCCFFVCFCTILSIQSLYLCFSVPFPCLPTLSSMDFPDLIYPWITEVDRISSPSSSNIRWSYNSIPKAIYGACKTTNL